MRIQYNKPTFEIINRKVIHDFSKDELTEIVKPPFPIEGTWKSQPYRAKSGEYGVRFFISNESFLYPLLISEIGQYYGSTRISPFLTFEEIMKQEPNVMINIRHPLVQYTIIVSIHLSKTQKNELKIAINKAHKSKFGSEIQDIDFEEISLFNELSEEDIKNYI